MTNQIELPNGEVMIEPLETTPDPIWEFNARGGLIKLLTVGWYQHRKDGNLRVTIDGSTDDLKRIRPIINAIPGFRVLCKHGIFVPFLVVEIPVKEYQWKRNNPTSVKVMKWVIHQLRASGLFARFIGDWDESWRPIASGEPSPKQLGCGQLCQENN